MQWIEASHLGVKSDIQLLWATHTHTHTRARADRNIHTNTHIHKLGRKRMRFKFWVRSLTGEAAKQAARVSDLEIRCSQPCPHAIYSAVAIALRLTQPVAQTLSYSLDFKLADVGNPLIQHLARHLH
jgi:hypothetical protein